MLVKRFEITQNRSLDAMDDIVNRRKMTEFGNVALIEERDAGDASAAATALRLPGVRKGDMASRAFKPEVRVNQVRFSPTGQISLSSSSYTSMYTLQDLTSSTGCIVLCLDRARLRRHHHRGPAGLLAGLDAGLRAVRPERRHHAQVDPAGAQGGGLQPGPIDGPASQRDAADAPGLRNDPGALHRPGRANGAWNTISIETRNKKM